MQLQTRKFDSMVEFSRSSLQGCHCGQASCLSSESLNLDYTAPGSFLDEAADGYLDRSLPHQFERVHSLYHLHPMSGKSAWGRPALVRVVGFMPFIYSEHTLEIVPLQVLQGPQ